jgi:hypothetical protein
VFRLSTVADGSQLIVGADFEGLAHDLLKETHSFAEQKVFAA